MAKVLKASSRITASPTKRGSTTVSAFTHQTDVVLNLQGMDNKQTSEIELVRQLIQTLAGQPVVFTLDALHCKKK